MTYDNGADNAFDKDLRNVDMTLEHPFGYVCNKQYPHPTNWGELRQRRRWISFGAKEEPERIVLADATQDGTYRVMVQYMEDCSSLPTELLAGLLGISVDALIAYLSGGVDRRRRRGRRPASSSRPASARARAATSPCASS